MTYGVSVVACGTHDSGEGWSISGPGREFVEDVAEGSREDTLDFGHLYSKVDQCSFSLLPIAPQREITCIPCHR